VPALTDVGFKVSLVTLGACTTSGVPTELCPNVALIWTVMSAAKAVVVAVKLAVVELAATVTLEGTEATAELLESETMSPPDGAGALMVTVPTELLPPVTEAGFIERPDIVVERIVSVALTLLPWVAVILAVCWVATCLVDPVKFAEDEPAGIEREVGTLAFLLLLASVTLNPPVGDGPLRVTVPAKPEPAATFTGFKVIPVRVGALISNDPVTADPVILAVTRTLTSAGTACVLQVKLAEVEPPGIDTEDGPPQAVELAVSVAVLPAAGAGPVSLSAPVVVLAPVTLPGLNVSELSFAARMTRFARAEDDPSVPFMVVVVFADTAAV